MTIHLPCCPFAPDRHKSFLVDLSLRKLISINFVQVEVKMCICTIWVESTEFSSHNWYRLQFASHLEVITAVLPPLSRPPGCLARSSQKKETATKLPGKQLSDPESLSCLLWDGIKTVFTWPNVLPKWFFKGIHNWLWRTPFHRSIRPVCSACLLCAASWIKFF